MTNHYKRIRQNHAEPNNTEITIRLRAAQKLAALGGSQPDMKDIPRRREKPIYN